MSIPRQAARRSDRRNTAEAILTAAARVFLAAGFGAVTMDAIAQEASVSKATVYAHFGGKDELFRAVIEHVRTLSERRVGGFSVEALDPHDIVGSLTAIAARYIDLVLSREAIALNRIIIAEVTRFPMLGQIFWSAGPERHRAQIESFIRRAAAAGSLTAPNPRLAAEQFLALARGDIHLRSLLGHEDLITSAVRDAAVTNAVTAFLQAIGRC